MAHDPRREKWLAQVYEQDPVLRQLQRRIEARVRLWDLSRAVLTLRRAGEPAPVAQVAERYAVSRYTVHRALRVTLKR